jgi:long-subunit fatty acid transport protein
MLCPMQLHVTLSTALAVALLVPAGARSADAGGFGVPELGVRRTAMAAVVGRPDEPAAVFHNAAGLTMLPGVHVYSSFGLALLSTEFRVQPWADSERFIDDPVDAEGYYPVTRPTRAMGVIPMLVVTADVWKQRAFAAFSLYVPNATGAKFDPDSVTRYHLIDGYIVSPLASLSGAYRVGPRLSVGGGLGIMNVRVHGLRKVFPIVNGTDLTALVGSEPELTLDGSDWVPSWNLGVLAWPTPKLSLGATLIGRVDADLQGPVKVVYSDDAAAPNTLMGRQSTELLLPWTFLAGANYDLGPNLELGSELRYYLYRQYERQHTDINDIFLVSELETIKDYDDSWQIAGGVRVHDLAAAPGLELMLGGHYDKTPAPARTVTLDQPTFSHYGLHSGVRYSRGRYRLGGSFLHYWYLIPTITDSITSPPSNVKGEGVNNIFTVSFEATFGARGAQP